MSLIDAHYAELKDFVEVFNAKGEQGRINYFHTRKELLAHLREGVDYLAQEFIEKEYEIDVNGISINHGGDVLIPGAVRKIREEYGRQSDFIVLEAIPEELDVAAIQRFVAAIGYEGLFSVEFMKKGDRFYFLEINLRNDGVNHFYADAGINMPELWARYKAGESIDLGGINLGLKLPRYLMQESDLANIRTGKVGVYAWLRDFCRAKSHFVFDMRDPLPYLYTVYIHFRQAGKKLIRKVAG